MVCKCKMCVYVCPSFSGQDVRLQLCVSGEIPWSPDLLVPLPLFSLLPCPPPPGYDLLLALAGALSPCVNSGRVSWPGWA